MSEQYQDSAHEVCRQIYRETKSFYGEICKGKDDCGFQILYGPPFFRTPILFLGYQPGRGTKSPLQERLDGSEERWPLRSEYATEDWPLAKRLRESLDEELIERCVGLNAIFVRSDNMAKFRRQFDLALRLKIQKFCLSRVEKMVNAIQPLRIIAIGFATLGLFCSSVAGRANESGRVLTRMGKIAGRPALGILHLSGARISKQDRETISSEIRVFDALAAIDLGVKSR
jgi:hypothetical protein